MCVYFITYIFLPCIAVRTVLEWKHNSLGKGVVLTRCEEKLEPSALNARIAPISKKMFSNKPFFIEVAQQHVACLQSYQQNLELQLKEFCASLYVDKERSQVQIIPCQGNERIEDWQSQCQNVVDRFIKSLVVETFSVPVDKKDIMRPVIDEAIKNEKFLYIEYVEDRCIVIIAGKHEGVNRVKKELDNICRTIVNEKFLVDNEIFLILLSKSPISPIINNFLSDHPTVRPSIAADNRSIAMTGFKKDCQQFESDLSKFISSLQCVPVLLVDPFAKFITTQAGRTLLNYYSQEFISEVVAYIDQTGKLFILGTSKSQTAIDALTRKIQDGLCCIHVPHPVKFQNSLRGREWRNFSASVGERQFVQVDVVKNQIIVIGDSQMCKFAKMEIENYIECDCVAVKEFKLCESKWRLIIMHMDKKWSSLKQKIQKNGRVQIIVPDAYDQKPLPSITIKGDKQAIKAAGKEIEDFLSAIVCSAPIKIIRCGVIEYFCSENGRFAVEQIETDGQSCVQLTIEDAGNAVQCNKVCSGWIANESVKISLYHGNITVLPVDVMVNATNLQLKHTSGVALAIANAGGPCIQSESDAYLQAVGNMKEGDVIMMKEVGNLPCKNLMHVISPTWKDGTCNEASLLKQACVKALNMASHFQTISFPAIGSGSYDFPTIVCATNMIEAVITYSQKNLLSSISEVSFVMFHQNEVDEFSSKMSQLLSNVSFASTTQKALTAVASTPVPKVPKMFKCGYDDAIIEEEGSDDFVIINTKGNSSHNHSTSIHNNNFQISTKDTTTSDSISTKDSQSQHNLQQYIELHNGELLQYPVSYNNLSTLLYY